MCAPAGKSSRTLTTLRRRYMDRASAALRHAISRYNTGDTERGIDNGYLGRVLSALSHSKIDAASSAAQSSMFKSHDK